MGWFTNKYEDKIIKLEGRWYSSKDTSSISYELGIMKDCERKLAKIHKILDRYEEDEADLKNYYNKVVDGFEEARNDVNNVKISMSYTVSYYVKSFDEKIVEMITKFDKQHSRVENDYKMITNAIGELENRKVELHDRFNKQYKIAKNKIDN